MAPGQSKPQRSRLGWVPRSQAAGGESQSLIDFAIMPELAAMFHAAEIPEQRAVDIYNQENLLLC